MADHIRIDEGVKRGKYPQRTNSNGSNELGQFKPVLPTDPAAIKAAIQDYADGATLKQIAQTHGVSKQAVYSWMLGDIGGQEHTDLVTTALTSRIADADERLDSSETPLDLARAREQARFRRMDFERRRSHLYGPKQEVTHTASPVLNIQIVVSSEPQSSAASPALPSVSTTVDVSD